MEHTKPTEAPETPEALEAAATAAAAKAERLAKLPTLEVLIARMIQTQRDIKAYRRGEMTKEEFDALGIKFF